MTRWIVCLGSLLAASPAAAEERPAPYETPAQPPPIEARRHGFSFKPTAGFAYRRLYSVPISGFEGGLAFGGVTRSGGWYGNLGGLFGATNEGLRTQAVFIGPSWEMPLPPPVSFELGVEILYLAMHRATTGAPMEGVGLGAFGALSVDLFELDPGYDVFVGLKGAGHAMSSPDSAAVLWGGTARIGIRH